jgi:hypothetical protein
MGEKKKRLNDRGRLTKGVAKTSLTVLIQV